MKLKLKKPAVKAKAETVIKRKDPLEVPAFLKQKPRKGGPSRLIEFKITGGKPVVKSFFRTFTSVDDARDYYIEFSKGRSPQVSKDGMCVTFPNSVDCIMTNFSVGSIMTRQPIPKDGLPTLHPVPSITTPGEADVTVPVSKIIAKRAESGASDKQERVMQRANGSVVELKVLCAELHVEPREARMKLRKAAKDRTKYPEIAKAHAANARWEFPKDSAFLKEVRTLLGAKS